MAWTNWGFDGTINEAQWAQLAPLMGNGYVAKDSASCVTTAVGGARKVSVSTGTLFGDGIVSVSDAAEEVTLTTPVNGQWYVIALKRVWATNTANLVAVAGATTSTTTPTAPPSTLPTLTANPGVDTEQPIAWAWANSANTTVVVFDMRLFPVRRTPLTVANAVARDAIFQAPTQGQEVWRNDLGAVETYYGLYNISTNPGGRSSAGWYQEPIGRVLQVVYGFQDTQVNTTAGYPGVTTGLTATITPKFANSRIIIVVSQYIQPVSLTNQFDGGFGIFRNNTIDLGGNSLGANAATGAGGALAIRHLASQVREDLPNTTSSVSYNTRLWLSNGLRYEAQPSNQRSTITIFEVAG